MKIHNNSKGFGVTGIFMTILLVLAVGGIGWYVYSHNNKPKAQQLTQSQVDKIEPKVENNMLDGYVQYENEEDGFTFIYPEGWTVKDTSLNDDTLFLSITSPDFVEVKETEYGGTISGVLISLVHVVSDYSQGGKPNLADGDKEIDRILNNSDNSDLIAQYKSEVSKETRINGSRSVSYGIGYEGPPKYSTIIDANKGYFIIQYTDVPYTEGSTQIKSAKFYKEYISIVNSFKSADVN